MICNLEDEKNLFLCDYLLVLLKCIWKNIFKIKEIAIYNRFLPTQHKRMVKITSNNNVVCIYKHTRAQ